MCLLVTLTRVQPSFPLIVGANRDELYERPAVAMAVLRPAGPRILGGRDQQAGGTWLAVNDAGVFAGITNSPTAAGRDPAKRSRGELPLAMARHLSASAAVEDFVATVDPADYNPAWLLVGDRTSLFAVDMSDGASLEVRALAPGVHVLENRPFGAPSPKVRHVVGLLGDVGGAQVDEIERRLATVLSDHQIPPGAGAREPDERARPAEVDAACVHTERYGTRWSAVVTVPASPGAPPNFRYADDAVCRSSYRDATWW